MQQAGCLLRDSHLRVQLRRRETQVKKMFNEGNQHTRHPMVYSVLPVCLASLNIEDVVASRIEGRHGVGGTPCG